MRFDFMLGSSSLSPRRAPGPVRRILVLADLRGNAASPAAPLLDRPITRVDVDNLDDVLARYAPAVQLTGDAGGDRLEVRRFDDFHPDALVEALPVFGRLREIRARLANPATYAAAVADLQTDTRAPVTPAADVPPTTQTPDGSLLGRLLGQSEPSQVDSHTTSRGPESAVDALIRQAIAPHVVAAPNPQLPQMTAAVDAGMTDLMRAVLHDPGFQDLERVWRAVQWLVSMLELDESLQLHLMHVTRDELPQGAAPGGDLWRRLVEREARPDGGTGVSALIGSFTFGASADDIAVLERMGALAAALGAPLVAGASTSLLGVPTLASRSDPRDWPGLEGENLDRWQAFRRSASAAHVGLALPRVLLRLPYGQRSDPIGAFAFEEQTALPDHESFLWGNAAWACAVVLARLLDPDADPAGASVLEGLPAFTFTADDEVRLQSPAEVNLTETAVAAIQARGLMPLVSYRDRDAVRLVGLHPVASVSAPR